MELSIIIPAFNESKKIADDIKNACNFLQSKGLAGEVIIVDDGSVDQTGESAIKAARDNNTKVEVKVICNRQHRGKGFAVRCGIRQAAGDYIMFVDSGNCIPYENIPRGLEIIKSGQCDIAHGSRNLPGAEIVKDHGIYRHICSAFFHWFSVKVMKVPAKLTDTQCGFKIYRGEAAHRLYDECATDGFMFDIEIILRAIKKGYRIEEFPVDWSCDYDSRLAPAKHISQMIAELMRIKARLKAEK